MGIMIKKKKRRPMKIDWNKKYTTITAYAILAVGACILFCAVIFNIGDVFSTLRQFLFILNPFLWGFALAYMFNKPVRFFEQKVFRFKNKKKNDLLIFLFSKFLICGKINLLMAKN